MSSACARRSAFGSSVLIISGSSRIVADPLARIERAIGILEHDLHGAAQRLRRRPAGGSTASTPSSISVPALGFSISVTMRASVDLPQPDSPTTASVRPGSSVNDTPPTACRCAGVRRKPRLHLIGALEIVGDDQRHDTVSRLRIRRRRRAVGRDARVARLGSPSG